MTTVGLRLPSADRPLPGRIGCLAIAALVLVAACRTGAVPPNSATPREVLAAFLAAAQARDCALARALVAPSGAQQVDSFCGSIQVHSFQIIGDGNGAAPNAHEVVFATMLGVSGGDVTLPDGSHTIFFDLLQQPGGEWRIAGGGSGP
jgi:hypothetical protein